MAGSGNNARFMRASVSFFCITCVYAYVYVYVCVCARSQMCVSFLMSVESDRGGGRGGSDRVSSSRVSR